MYKKMYDNSLGDLQNITVTFLTTAKNNNNNNFAGRIKRTEPTQTLKVHVQLAGGLSSLRRPSLSLLADEVSLRDRGSSGPSVPTSPNRTPTGGLDAPDYRPISRVTPELLRVRVSIRPRFPKCVSV